MQQFYITILWLNWQFLINFIALSGIKWYNI